MQPSNFCELLIQSFSTNWFI